MDGYDLLDCQFLVASSRRHLRGEVAYEGLLRRNGLLVRAGAGTVLPAIVRLLGRVLGGG